MTDETSKAIIDKITVTYPGLTKIPSGHTSRIYYNCTRLTPNDLARLAAETTGHLDQDAFDIVVGIAYTGIFFGSAVAGGREVALLQADGKLFGPDAKGKRVIVTDDVVYSGLRMREAAKAVEKVGGLVIGYACIIDRSEGRADLGGKPLYSAYQTGM